jgi:hypothetical protein
MRLAVGVDHFIYGWFLFSLLLLVVFATGLRFADRNVPDRSRAPLRFVAEIEAHPGRHALAAAVGVAILAIGPLALAGRMPVKSADNAVSVPAELAAAQLAGETGRPKWLRADNGWRSRHLAFAGTPPFEVHLFQGAGLGGGDLTALRQQLATERVILVADEEVRIAGPMGPLSVREMRLQEGQQELTVGYWFVVGAERTANPVTAKIMEVRTIMKGEHIKPVLTAVVLNTNGLDQPGASLHAIIADLATATSACGQPAVRPAPPCKTFVPVSE